MLLLATCSSHQADLKSPKQYRDQSSFCSNVEVLLNSCVAQGSNFKKQGTTLQILLCLAEQIQQPQLQVRDSRNFSRDYS